MHGEVGVTATEAGYEVILVGLDGAFCGVGVMKVCGEQVGTLRWNRAEIVSGRWGIRCQASGTGG